MKNLLNIVLVIALIAGAIYIKDRFFPNIKVKTTTVTKTTIDTIYEDSLVYKELAPPTPDTVYMVDTVIIPPDDSLKHKYAQLYQKYYSQYFYADTLKDDSSALVVVDDRISQNKYLNRALYFRNRRPTAINKTIINEVNNQRKIFLGGAFGEATAEPAIMYKDLNDITYKVGYDFAGRDKGIRIGVYFDVYSGF